MADLVQALDELAELFAPTEPEAAELIFRLAELIEVNTVEKEMVRL